MSKGGARIRSGPQPDPKSGRSEQRGYTLTALPAEGYTGPIPKFPLPAPVLELSLPRGPVSGELLDILKGERDEAQQRITAREAEVWAELWRTPQACAWSLPSEAWRLRHIAMYCRVSVRCEAGDVPASFYAQVHRFADQIGLTSAGLAMMGWKVAEDEVAAKAQQRSSKAPAEKPAAPTRRLRAVNGG